MAEQTIETFAELMARLDEPFADRAHVLKAAGLDDGDHQRLVDRWSKELRGDDGAQLAQRYGDAYEAAVHELAAARRGERAAPDLRFLNADAQSFREEAAAVPLHAPAEPSAERLLAPPTPIPLPVASPPIAPPPAAPLLNATTSDAVPSHLSPVVPEGMRGFNDILSTQLSTGAPRGPVLPFDPNAKPTISAQSDLGQGPPHPANIVPEGMRGFNDIHSTELSTGAPKGPALPFEPSLSTEPTPATREEPPPLSLEQYASLCVELSAASAERPEILRRYRLSEEQHRRAEGYWQARMAADAMVWIAWDRACATYRAWLAQNRGSSP